MDRDFFYKPFFDVKKFMEACGQSTLYAYDTQVDLYKKLIDEEYGEFQEAFKNNDEAEQIDAGKVQKPKGWEPANFKQFVK